MTRVLLLGASGMLGEAIRLAAPDDITVDYPSSGHVLGREELLFDRGWILSSVFHQHPDVIINAIGVRPMRALSAELMAYVNGVFPHVVVDAARGKLSSDPVPVIHVSTDCVFGGMECRDGADRCMAQSHGPDAFPPAPDTLYGRTKLAGESDLAINVRTSFVGPRHGLWKWFADQRVADPGGSVEGWANAWWSGSTVNAVARELLELARHPGDPRVLHLATKTPLSKFDLLCTLQRQAVSGGTIEEMDEPRIDRSLAPDIILPPFADALREMVP